MTACAQGCRRGACLGPVKAWPCVRSPADGGSAGREQRRSLAPVMEGHRRVYGLCPDSGQVVGEALPGMSAWRIRTHKPGNSCGEQNGRLKPTCIKCADGRSPSVGAQAGGPSKALASFDRAVDHTISSAIHRHPRGAWISTWSAKSGGTLTRAPKCPTLSIAPGRWPFLGRRAIACRPRRDRRISVLPGS